MHSDSTVGEVSLDVRPKLADQISSTLRSVIWRSVAELICMDVEVDGMPWRTAGK